MAEVKIQWYFVSEGNSRDRAEVDLAGWVSQGYRIVGTALDPTGDNATLFVTLQKD